MFRLSMGGMLASFCGGYGVAAEVYHAPDNGPAVYIIWGLIVVALCLAILGVREIWQKHAQGE